MPVVIESSAGGSVQASDAAQRFAEVAAAKICEVLVSGKRSFKLMPYRHCSAEYLGFDWQDEADNGVVMTFTVGTTRPDLPAKVHPGGTDVWVSDYTDALLLVRLIAERVNANSVGQI